MTRFHLHPAGRAPAVAAAIAALVACRTSPQTRPSPGESLVAQGRAQWVKLPTEPYKGKQDDVFFLTPSLGWYVNGGEGKIYKTTDGGQSWAVKVAKPGTYFRSIGFVDERHGFAGNLGPDYFPGVTDPNPLYETFDGGDTWAPAKDFPLPQGSGVCSIDLQRGSFINAGELDHRTMIHVAGRVGGPAYLVRSLDGGASWKLVDLRPHTAMVLDVRFFDANVGFIAGATDREIERSHALVLRTGDGGDTWTRVYESSRPSEITWKLSFPSRDVGYVTVMSYDENPSVAARFVGKTEDGGRTWRELPLVSDHAQQEYGVAFASPLVGWVGAKSGGYQTVDGGKTWTHLEMGRAVNKIRVVPAADGFVAFAIGSFLYKLDARPQGAAAEATIH